MIDRPCDCWHLSACRVLEPANTSSGAAVLQQCSCLSRYANLRCHRPHGRVVAIVRAGSDEEAARRLRASFDSGDADLLRTYDALSAEHLTVYTGMFSPFCPLIFHQDWLGGAPDAGGFGCCLRSVVAGRCEVLHHIHVCECRKLADCRLKGWCYSGLRGEGTLHLCVLKKVATLMCRRPGQAAAGPGRRRVGRASGQRGHHPAQRRAGQPRLLLRAAVRAQRARQRRGAPFRRTTADMAAHLHLINSGGCTWAHSPLLPPKVIACRACNICRTLTFSILVATPDTVCYRFFLQLHHGCSA